MHLCVRMKVVADMRKTLAYTLTAILLLAAIACGGSDEDSSSKPPVFSPTRVIDIDELPFTLLEGSEPFVFNNKVWMRGTEKPTGKADNPASSVSIWSSADFSVWAKVAEGEALPWKIEGLGRLFVYGKKALYFGEAKIGEAKLWQTTDFVQWSEVADMNAFPFVVDYSRDPVEFAGKSWWLGVEKTEQKDDGTSGGNKLWSTSDFTEFYDIVLLGSLPMDIVNSDLFVFNRKYYFDVYQQTVVVEDRRLYAFAYPNETGKLDRDFSEGFLYNTLNGIDWSRIEASPYSQFRMVAIPVQTMFHCVGDYLVCLAQYAPDDAKSDSEKAEGGLYFWRSKDAASWVRAFALSTAEFITDDSTCFFVMNRAMWAIASTQDGVMNEGRCIWKITR